MLACFGGASDVGITLAGGDRRVSLAATPTNCACPPRCSTTRRWRARAPCSAHLFLLPGIGESLRVNGRVTAAEGDEIRIAIDECYGHCAKALIRSGLWSAQATAGEPRDAASFVADSRFLALASVSAQGRGDLSPKGDAAGFMARLDGNTLWFADRPGNRRVDSFRNIIDQPQVALALLIPGSTQVAFLRGKAQLTIDAAVRARFTVQDKLPLLAIRVDVSAMELRTSPTLERASLWPVLAHSDIDPAQLFVEHIKLNKATGVGAALARASLAVPGVTGLLKKGLEHDYKTNLY